MPRCATIFIIAIAIIHQVELKCVYNYGEKNLTECQSFEELSSNVAVLSNRVRIKFNETANLEAFIKPVSGNIAKSIQRLEIHKSINNITADALKHLINLSHLYLTYNKLPTLQRGIFTNLINLTVLHLSYNEIEAIQPEAFGNLTTLQILRMTHNNLTTIPRMIFNGLSCDTLALSNNQIYHIEKQALGNMKNLTKLYLDYNKLSEFHAQEVLNPVDKLERLWLHFNRLTEVTGYMLEGLASLQVLNLNHNIIATIEPEALAQTPKLTLLVLSNNLLKTLPGNILPATGLNSLKKLYLNHNRLEFLQSTFLFKLRALSGITIGGNPWQCPCLDLLLKWLYNQQVALKCDYTYFSGKRPVCVTPEIENLCQYIYNDELYEHFHDNDILYAPYPRCLL